MCAAGICLSVPLIKALGVRVKIVKMDRRYTLYHQGFTYQIKNMSLEERNDLSSFFTMKYGYSSEHVFYNNMIQRKYNTHWRCEQAKRRFTGGTKIYVRHEQDLVMLALKFSAKIG